MTRKEKEKQSITSPNNNDRSSHTLAHTPIDSQPTLRRPNPLHAKFGDYSATTRSNVQRYAYAPGPESAHTHPHTGLISISQDEDVDCPRCCSSQIARLDLMSDKKAMPQRRRPRRIPAWDALDIQAARLLHDDDRKTIEAGLL